jgi:sulfate/thiosulfate transport system substrate-binding protein
MYGISQKWPPRPPNLGGRSTLSLPSAYGVGAMRSSWKYGISLLCLGALWLTGCSPVGAQKPTVELTFVAYAVGKPVFAQLIPAFQKEWKAKTGQEVVFRESYGPSGAQTRALLDGLEADIMAQSIQTNVDKLVKANLVAKNWSERLPYGASPAHSVMVLVYRPGNPKNIQTWSDLTRKDVSIIAINPKTSGSGRWGILAGYGAIAKAEGEKQAAAFVFDFLSHTKSLESGSRQSTDAFVRKQMGDVMVNYENEIIFVNKMIPKDFPYLAPKQNIQVDFPVTVIDQVVDKRGTRAVAEAFTQFLFTPKAQQVYAEFGYRPSDPKVFAQYAKEYQSVPQLYAIADFGGWKAVNKKLFDDGALFDQAQAAAGRPIR